MEVQIEKTPASDEKPKSKRVVLNKKRLEKQLEIREARLKGLAYTNTNGNIVAAKSPAFQRDCQCKSQCFSKLLESDVQRIFNRYRSFETPYDQDCYLQSLIVANPVQRRRARNGSKKGRIASFVYDVPVQGGKRVRVCQKAFVNLHDISKKKLERLAHLVVEGKDPVDMRGLFKNSSKTRPLHQIKHEPQTVLVLKEEPYETETSSLPSPPVPHSQSETPKAAVVRQIQVERLKQEVSRLQNLLRERDAEIQRYKDFMQTYGLELH